MAIKKLQNNFTTPEQSKRLLELGVPADSADCVLVRNLYFPKGEYEIKVLDGKYSRFIEMHDTLEIVPCWSVGRMIEICSICIEHYTGDNKLVFDKGSLYLGNVKCLIATIQIACDDGDIDFSKLEE